MVANRLNLQRSDLAFDLAFDFAFQLVFFSHLVENNRKVFFSFQKECQKVQKTYTIRQIADAIGYTKPSISKAIKELGITPAKNGNTNILTQEQAEMIAAHFGKTLQESAANDEVTNSDSEKVLKQYIELLEQQLAAKDELLLKQQETINQLVDSNKALSASIAANEAKALLMQPIQEQENKEQEQQETAQEQKKKGFWARILGK